MTPPPENEPGAVLGAPALYYLGLRTWRPRFTIANGNDHEEFRVKRGWHNSKHAGQLFIEIPEDVHSRLAPAIERLRKAGVLRTTRRDP